MRVQCSVPHCGRTVAAEKIAPHSEWLCQKHYPLVSRHTKRRKRLAHRIAERVFERLQPVFAQQGDGYTEAQWQRLRAAEMRAAAWWERCKSEAIERGMGI